MFKRINIFKKTADDKTKLFSNSKIKILLCLLLVLIIFSVIIALFVVKPDKSNNDNNKEVCTIQFNSNGGTEINDLEFVCGSQIDKPSIPEKDGFEFEGWYYNDVLFDFSSEIESSIILQARWKVKDGVETIVVSFNTDGGSEQDIIYILKGSALIPPLNPTKKGFVFEYWMLNGKEYDFTTNLYEDVVLTAKWKVDKNNKVINKQSGSCSYSVFESYENNFNFNVKNGEFDYMIFEVPYVPFSQYSNSCEIKFSSNNTNVAVVDQSGLITALDAGNAIISACVYERSTGKKIDCVDAKVSANAGENTYYPDPRIPFNDIEGRWYAKNSDKAFIDLSGLGINKKHNYQVFVPFFAYIDENTLDYCEIGKCDDSNKYKSDSKSYTVSDFEEKYSMKLKGDVLTLSINGKTVEFTRNPAVIQVSSFTLNKESESIEVGEQTSVFAYVSPANAKNSDVKWTNSNPSVAKITNYNTSNDDKKITSSITINALSKGVAIFTATTGDGTISKQFELIVTKSEPEPPVVEEKIFVNGISLNKNDLTLIKGNSASLEATVKPSNASNKKVLWSSSNSSVATVENSGKITAIKKGEATITAKTEDGGYEAKCLVTVSNPALSTSGSIGVKMVTTNSKMEKGLFATIRATGGSGDYVYYYIKIYKDDKLIGSTTDTSSNELFILGFSNGKYKVEYEVRDSDGAVKTGSFTSEISGF